MQKSRLCRAALLAPCPSLIPPRRHFPTELLEQYHVNPGFGGALEHSPQGRLQLAAAVLTARAGAKKTGEAFLSAAARVSAREASRPWRRKLVCHCQSPSGLELAPTSGKRTGLARDLPLPQSLNTGWPAEFAEAELWLT